MLIPVKSRAEELDVLVSHERIEEGVNEVKYRSTAKMDTKTPAHAIFNVVYDVKNCTQISDVFTKGEAEEPELTETGIRRKEHIIMDLKIVDADMVFMVDYSFDKAKQAYTKTDDMIEEESNIPSSESRWSIQTKEGITKVEYSTLFNLGIEYIPNVLLKWGNDLMLPDMIRKLDSLARQERYMKKDDELEKMLIGTKGKQ